MSHNFHEAGLPPGAKEDFEQIDVVGEEGFYQVKCLKGFLFTEIC